MRKPLFILLLAAGCSSAPAPSDPPAAPPSGSGLFDGGPLTGVEQGPGSRSLYKDFLDAQARLAKQAEELEKLRRRLQEAEDALVRITAERDASRTALAGAEAERDQARARLRDRDLQLLALALEKTRAEQALLQQRIDALSRPVPDEKPPEGL